MGARDSAIRNDRAFVGGDGGRAAAVMRENIGAWKQVRNLRRFHRRRDWIRGIGAGIDIADAVNGNEPTVSVGIPVDLIVMLATIGIGGEMLATILQPAHRTIHPLR